MQRAAAFAQCEAAINKLELQDEGASELSKLERRWKELYPDRVAPGGEVIAKTSIAKTVDLLKGCLTFYVLGRVCNGMLDFDISLRDANATMVLFDKTGAPKLFEKSFLSSIIAAGGSCGCIGPGDLPIVIEVSIKTSSKTLVRRFSPCVRELRAGQGDNFAAS